MLLGHGGRGSARDCVAGQVASKAGQLVVSAGRLSKASPLAELLKCQPALADRSAMLRSRSASEARIGVGWSSRSSLIANTVPPL